MKCLIVITHPLNDSLCKQLAKHVENKLNNMGHEVTIEDLYTQKFEPALTPLRESLIMMIVTTHQMSLNK